MPKGIVARHFAIQGVTVMATRGFKYFNFDLVVSRADEGYSSAATSDLCPGSTAKTGPFGPPAFDLDPTLGPAPAGQDRDVFVTRSPAVATANQQQLGQRLYEYLFHKDGLPNEAGQLLDECLKRRGSDGLRLRLDFGQAPALAVLPWEYLRGPNEDPFALSNKTPVVRVGLTAGPVQPGRAVELPLRVLAIISPASTDLDLDGEWEELRSALSDLVTWKCVEIDALEPRTLAGLQDALRDHEYHVIHFMGHGGFDARTNKAVLLFDKETPAEHLALHLGNHPPRLAFLNACNSGKSSPGDALAGTAQRLIAKQVPEVVAMQFPIGDRAAVRLAREFYEAIADGYPVEAALGEARLAVLDSQQQGEWSTPVLFSCGAGSMALNLPEPPPPYKASTIEPETVVIPAGRFWFGSRSPEDQQRGARPPSQLRLPTYAIGRRPVTNRQYAYFVAEKANQARIPRDVGWSYINPPQTLIDAPVAGVTWDDACSYCQWLSGKTGQTYRLPTEAEWEKAARGDQDQRRYPWGNDPADVGGASPYGCYDLVGKMYEWTCTKWDGDTSQAYSAREVEIGRGAPAVNLLVDSLTLRGGPLKAGGPTLTCSTRVKRAGLREGSSVGFRVVRVVG